MNERIGKLAEQTGLLGPSSRVGNAHEATEKFAELVIQECIKIMHINERIPEGFFYAKPVHIHELAIKQHFGLHDE